jgi:hypothetical protein
MVNVAELVQTHISLIEQKNHGVHQDLNPWLNPYLYATRLQVYEFYIHHEYGIFFSLF